MAVRDPVSRRFQTWPTRGESKTHRVDGSLATILWLLALRKERLDVSFWKFLEVGVIAMPIALAAALSGAIAIQLFMPSQ